jgi:hypothetical protein
MGVSLSWIAIKNVPKERVLGWMNLKETRRPGEPMTSEFCGAQHGDWYVVCAKGTAFAEEENLFELSHECEVLGGIAEEMELRSQLVLYKNRSCVWRVEYLGDEGPKPEALEADGPVPPEFAAIRAEMLALQANEPRDADIDHIYDVPLELSRRLCGFHYDPDGKAPNFAELENTAAQSPEVVGGGWFKKLFGR